MSLSKVLKNVEQVEAVKELRAILKPGDVIRTVIRSVAKSGMSRTMDLYVIRDGDLRYLTGWVATACGYRRTDQGALKVSGCGMDMGFAVVYELSRKLFPDGFAVEGRGRNGDTSGHDNDGGYALKQQWI